MFILEMQRGGITQFHFFWYLWIYIHIHIYISYIYIYIYILYYIYIIYINIYSLSILTNFETIVNWPLPSFKHYLEFSFPSSILQTIRHLRVWFHKKAAVEFWEILSRNFKESMQLLRLLKVKRKKEFVTFVVCFTFRLLGINLIRR